MSSPNLDLTYYMWANKVNSYIKFLINKDKINISKFLYNDFFNNGFDPKITAILAIQNENPSFDYQNYTLWKNDLHKYITIFFDKNKSKNLDLDIYKESFNNKIHPVYVSSNILKNFGYLTLSYPLEENNQREKIEII